jgi:hypothetical protein
MAGLLFYTQGPKEKRRKEKKKKEEICVKVILSKHTRYLS